MQGCCIWPAVDHARRTCVGPHDIAGSGHLPVDGRRPSPPSLALACRLGHRAELGGLGVCGPPGLGCLASTARARPGRCCIGGVCGGRAPGARDCRGAQLSSPFHAGLESCLYRTRRSRRAAECARRCHVHGRPRLGRAPPASGCRNCSGGRGRRYRMGTDLCWRPFPEGYRGWAVARLCDRRRPQRCELSLSASLRCVCPGGWLLAQTELRLGSAAPTRRERRPLLRSNEGAGRRHGQCTQTALLAWLRALGAIRPQRPRLRERWEAGCAALQSHSAAPQLNLLEDDPGSRLGRQQLPRCALFGYPAHTSLSLDGPIGIELVLSARLRLARQCLCEQPQ